MDKYIGLDMDSNKTIACIVEEGQKDRYATLGPDIDSLRDFLLAERSAGGRVHAAFEIGGQAGWLCDNLLDCVDVLKVVNPARAT